MIAVSQTLRMRNPALGAIAALLLTVPSLACINTFTSEIMRYKREGDSAGMAQLAAQAEVAYREKPTLETANDAAVTKILTGKVVEGIQLLRDLEKQTPGSAIVAANLGTALELSGANKEALHWIAESVRRDPKEHQGSEWVHVKILEAKLELARNSDWLRDHSVIGWRLGDPLPANETGPGSDHQTLAHAIKYQLYERTVFVDPPDPVVADLYLTLADLTYSASHAFDEEILWLGQVSSDLEEALSYGTVHEARARQTLADVELRLNAAHAVLAAHVAEKEKAEAKRREELGRKRRSQRATWISVLSAVAVSLGLFAVWRRRRLTKP